MKTEPGNTLVGAWVRLLRGHTAALSKVENALKESGLPPLGWYDVLLELQRVGDTGMRPFELERELLLPQYGLSRLLNRIEASGYLERRPCEEDGRGQILVITKAGKQMRRRMWPTYGKAIKNAIGERLTKDEAVTLDELLSKLL